MRLAALVCAALFSVVCSGASPAIGTVTSAGHVATSLSDGSVVQTSESASDVRLESGAAMHLAARSSSAVFSDHAVLQQGAARVSNFTSYSIQAGSLRIESETPDASAVIRFQKDAIEIASLSGAVKVSDGGSLLTRVAAGSHMAFQNSGAAPGQTGAAPAKKRRSEMKTWAWVVVGISAAALAIGLTAAAQGKSPF